MSIAEIHEDIIQTHILTRLDGQTLAAAASTSSKLHSLAANHLLWSDICSATWPSSDHPLLRHAIAQFPSAHRSFFSDAFPSPPHHLPSTTTAPPHTPHLISAVDLRYLDNLLFSKVESTATVSNDWFQTSPFRIDLLEPKEKFPSSVNFTGDDVLLKSNLEQNLTLTWILIDPTRNRAVNVSSTRPVSVQRNWLTGDIEVTFATVVTADGGAAVNCNIEVACTVKEGGGELTVGGVSLTVQDLDGKCMSGRDCMVILQGMIGAEKRKKWGEEGRERYEGYLGERRERKERRERREKRLDMVCIACGVAIFMAFWSFVLY